MKKVYILSSILTGTFLLASFALAQSIPNYGPTDFKTLFTGIAKVVGDVIGSLGTIMFIVSGIFFATSAGNPQRIETAKKTLLYAVAGMVIGFGASAIVSTVSGWVQ